MPLKLGEHAAHEQGASRGVGLEIVGDHDGHLSPLLRASHGGTHLLAEHLGCASGSDPTIEPAITPVHQAKAIHLAIVPRRFDQALPTAPLATPYPRHGRRKSNPERIVAIQAGRSEERV